jgi:hypothetical protein
MTFDLAADMDSVFLSSGFNETVTYTPENGVAEIINSIVFRDTESMVSINNSGGNFNQVRHYDIQVYVSRTNVPVVKINADKVALKACLGDTTDTTYTVSKIIRQDGGAFRLGLL